MARILERILKLRRRPKKTLITAPPQSEELVVALMIDGPHQGKKFKFPPPVPKVLSLERFDPMHTIQVDDGNSPPTRTTIVDYRLCFMSYDGKMLLYSTTGNSEDIYKFYQVEISFFQGTK